MHTNAKLFKAGTIFNDFKGKIETNKIKLLRKSIRLNFPTRLGAMPIDDTVLAVNSKHVYPAGEIVISIDNPIKVTTNFLGNNSGILLLDNNVKNPAVINHGYRIMCKVLNVSPSFSISIDDSRVPRHSGFASNGATLGAVCSSINELFGNPIQSGDLLRFLATNYGEQYTDNGNSETLRKNMCIGGSLATGLYKDGIQVLSPEYTLAGSTKYDGSAVIGIPRDYRLVSSKVFIDLEQATAKKLSDTPNEDYKRFIITNLEQVALPKLASKDISGISDIVFENRFKDECGVSIKRLISKVSPSFTQIAKNVKWLYESDKPHCDMLGISSMSPTFFALTSCKVNENMCIKSFEEQSMDVFVYPVYNDIYSIEA